MIGYAASTGTRRNIAALHRAGWHLLLTPAQSRPHGLPYAIDNGAFGAWQQGIEWDARPFERLLVRHGSGADFIVLPDIVAGGMASLARSLIWRDRLAPMGVRLLLPVQDGMASTHVAALIGPALGIFVGGTTEWKLGTLPMWGALARQRRAYLHIGRVNTRRRIRLCHLAGADSFDGTSVSRYATTLAPLDAEVRQPTLPLGRG